MPTELYVTARLILDDGAMIERLVGPFAGAIQMSEWGADFMELGHGLRRPVAKSASISYLEVSLAGRDATKASTSPTVLAGLMLREYRRHSDLLRAAIVTGDFSIRCVDCRGQELN